MLCANSVNHVSSCTDLGIALGKKVALDIKGDELRVHNKVSEALSNSLIHMVRNCVDHGIESLEEREKLGKIKIGTIKLVSTEEGENVVVTLSDDGRGIDKEKIKAIALKKGLYSKEDLSKMSDAQVYEIIFDSGFSTAEKVTAVSGRGMGMDMVRQSIQSVGGQIDIQSQLGFGSIFKITIPKPKSVVIIPSLLVDCLGRAYCIPQDKIDRIITINETNRNDCICYAEGSVFLNIEGQLCPIISIRKILGSELTQADLIKEPQFSLVVVSSKGKRIAIAVDKVMDIEDIVVKNLTCSLAKIQPYLGATFLGDGSVGLILNIEGIASLYRAQEHQRVGSDSSIKPATFEGAKENTSYILFQLKCTGTYAAPLAEVFRLEEVNQSRISYVDNQKVFIYRDKATPIIEGHIPLKLNPTHEQASSDNIPMIVIQQNAQFRAIAVKSIDDMISTDAPIDTSVIDRFGVLGTIASNDKTVTVVDLKKLAA